MHTFRLQHVPGAQTLPSGQPALVAHPARPSQGVLPSAQNPSPSVMDAHTHRPPAPHGPNVEQVCPVHEFHEHAPLVQPREGHCRGFCR